MMGPPPIHWSVQISFSSAEMWYKLTEIKDWFYNPQALMLDTLAPGFLENDGRKWSQLASHISGYLRHLKVSNFHFLSLLSLCEWIKPAQTLWCFLLDWRCKSETVSRQMRQRSDAIKTFSAFMGLILFPLWSSKHTSWHRKWNETPEESEAVLYWVSSARPTTVLWNN